MPATCKRSSSCSQAAARALQAAGLACAVSNEHDVARVQPHARDVHASREQATTIVPYVHDKPAQGEESETDRRTLPSTILRGKIEQSAGHDVVVRRSGIGLHAGCLLLASLHGCHWASTPTCEQVLGFEPAAAQDSAQANTRLPGSLEGPPVGEHLLAPSDLSCLIAARTPSPVVLLKVAILM